MKIVSEFTYEKKALPSGKLTARWIYSRGVYQTYLSGRYLTGVDGDTEEECYRELHAHYDCGPDIMITFQ
tara:strand:+ start:282 stop:491 length:210 start_codon:yes stop_codon:yes gene_type:complete